MDRIVPAIPNCVIFDGLSLVNGTKLDLIEVTTR